MHLTKRRIDAARYVGDGKSRCVLWDDNPRGFGLRIYPSGRKAFVIAYRLDGKHLVAIGAYGTLTLDKARENAKRELGRVLDGDEPQILRRRRQGTADTFKGLAELYLERHARPRKKPKSAHEDERIIRRELLPKWAAKPLASIKRRDVIALLDAIKDRGAPMMANRVLALVRKMFNFAISRDLVEANPCAQVEPPAREQPRQRVLEDCELKVLWLAFDRLPSLTGALFKLRTLTLARGGEVKTMRWRDLDLLAGWWTIPPEYSKNGLAHRVPLTAAAVGILEAMRPLAHASGWVFPSLRQPSRHLADLSHAMTHLRQWSGVEFRGHDLRRTGASKLTGLGIPRLVVSKLLNHADSTVTAIYDRHSYDAEKRRALEAWSGYLLRVTGEDAAGAKVVSLR